MCTCMKQNDHTWLCINCAKNVQGGVKFDVLKICASLPTKMAKCAHAQTVTFKIVWKHTKEMATRVGRMCGNYVEVYATVLNAIYYFQYFQYLYK